MAKLVLSTDDGEVLGIWAVTAREGNARAYRIDKPLARQQLIEEVLTEIVAHEREAK
jgi:hypothetical protein